MSATLGGGELQFASLGKKLALAREARGLTVEQVAKVTRIRPQMLLNLEADDFTHFSHPSYLRLYLMDYARFLEVPLHEIRDWLPDAGSPGSENYEYINGLGSDAAGQVKKEYYYPRNNSRLNWQRAVRVLLVCAVLGLGFAIYKLVQDLARISAAEAGQTAAVEKVEPSPTVVVETVTVTSTETGKDSFGRNDGEFLLNSTNATGTSGASTNSSTGKGPSASIMDQQGDLSLSNPPAPAAPVGAQIQ